MVAEVLVIRYSPCPTFLSFFSLPLTGLAKVPISGPAQSATKTLSATATAPSFTVTE